ncbi:putative yir1 protein [Plasmodium yoelii yoelii]|nr:putative yir1 protein [Plasmodium yoelii yoelii]
MLRLKTDNNRNNITDFYTKYTENITDYNYCKNYYDDCTITLKSNLGYNSFKEIIDEKKDLLNINFEDMPKFYYAFKLLCKLYTESDEDNPDCTKHLKDANEFAVKYEELNKDSNITKDSSYSKLLFTLSTDYDRLKNKCEDFPLLQEIKTAQDHMQSSKDDSEQIYVHGFEATSSNSSITNKLIPVLSILVAIVICLGISYKYSLFEFRKRSQKQHLREKLKK